MIFLSRCSLLLSTRSFFSVLSTSMDPNNLQPVTNLNASDLPEGFTMADPGPAQSQQQQQPQQQQQQQQKQAILEQALTSDALARLRRIKLVNKNVDSLENGIVSMAMNGKLPGPITEGKLIEMLERMNPHNRSQTAGGTSAQQIQIQRKKYAFDSDDDDEDDNDL